MKYCNMIGQLKGVYFTYTPVNFTYPVFQLKVVQQEVFQTPLLICQPALTLKYRSCPPELQRKTSSMIILKICTPDSIHQCLKPVWMLQVMRHTLHSCISWHPFARDMRWMDYTWESQSINNWPNQQMMLKVMKMLFNWTIHHLLCLHHHWPQFLGYHL